MLATDLNGLLRVPGRLVVNPNDLTQAFPYGGTALGLVRDIVAEPGQKISELREEGLGVATVAGIDLGQNWGLAATIRVLEEGLASNWFTVQTGAVSGEPGVVHNPVSNPPGTVIATVKLLFAPLDELQHFFLYFPAAFAKPAAAARIANKISAEAGLPVAYKATPRSSDGYAVLWKKKEDLVL